ncbi:MAG: ATP-binding protein [Bacillota bacterium]
MLSNEELINEWEKYSAEIEKNPTIRKVTIEGWKRSQFLGINPQKLEVVFLNNYELIKKQEQYSQLIEAATPYLDCLSFSLAGKPHIVALSDKEGWIIAKRGNPPAEWDRTAGIDLGANWSERYLGNNGIGTALELKQPVFIYGVEHFAEPFKTAACLGVPIFCRDELIGALDVSVPTPYGHPARVILAMACVESIQKALDSENQVIINQAQKFMAIGTLLSNSAHDIKNALTVIRGLGQLGSLYSQDAKDKQFFGEIVKKTDNLSETIYGCLNIFTNQPKLDFQPLNNIIRETLDEIAPICKLNGIEIRISLDEEKTIVQLNKDLLKKALLNLFNNAIQAMRQGGILTVRQKGTLLEINDTGTGIPEEIQGLLFKKSFVTTKEKGSGIGLYLVNYVVVKIHNGKIWFKSKTGEGTTFFIEIPAK